MLNAEGQIVRRDEGDQITSNGDPHEIWYRFNGRELGYVGNNWTNNLTADQAVKDRREVAGNGAFRNGTTTGTQYADFSTAYDALNSFQQGSATGAYTVQRTGETLSSIAQGVWGDASLWYKLAEANGLQGDATLVEGQRLVLPAGVARSKHSAGSFKPYNAAEAIGNVSPTTPTPKQRKCGVFGQILLAVVAIAVTVIAPFGGGAVAQIFNAMLGSVVSQGVGVATGIQDKFSFKAVAMAGIGAAVGGFLKFNAFGNATAGSLQAVGNAVVQGAVHSAITQGIGVATGLQNKFSFAGIAAAGVAAGVGEALGGNLKDLSGKDADRSFRNIAAHTGVGAASLIASAATRSAIEGSSFGDNILAGLPDVLGQVIGRALGSKIHDPEVAAARRSANEIVVTLGTGPAISGTPTEQVNTSAAGTDTGGSVEEIVVTAPNRAQRESARRAEYLGLSLNASRLNFSTDSIPFPSEEALIKELAAASKLSNTSGSRAIDLAKSLLQKGSKGLLRGIPIQELFESDRMGSIIEIPLYIDGELTSATLNFELGDITDYSIVSDGKLSGFAYRTNLDGVTFVSTADRYDGVISGTEVNSIVVANANGIRVGHGYTTTTREEAELISEAIASGKGFNEINHIVADHRSKQAGYTSRGSPSEVRYGERVGYDVARNSALDWIESRGISPLTDLTVTTMNRWTDTPYGRSTADGLVGFRVEYDTRSGAHINVFDHRARVPVRQHFEFEGTRSTVENITKRFGS